MTRRSLSLLSLASAALIAFTGCALRPRYTQLLERAGVDRATAQDGSTAAVRVVDSVTGAPIEGANVTFGEGRLRFRGKTDANGVVNVPVGAAYVRDNALVVVELPPKSNGYRLEPAAGAAPGTDAAPSSTNAAATGSAAGAGTAAASGGTVQTALETTVSETGVAWRPVNAAGLEPVAVDAVALYTLREPDRLPAGVGAAQPRNAEHPESNVLIDAAYTDRHRVVGVAEIANAVVPDDARNAIAEEAARRGANAVVFVEEGDAQAGRFVAVALRLAAAATP